VSRIEQLSQEQVARLAEFRERWLRIGLATGPGDRAAAIAGVNEAYAAAGLKSPKIVIWLGSPLAGAIGAAMLARPQVGAQVGAQVRDQVGDQVGAQVRDQVGAQVWAQVWAQVGAQVGAQVWAQVGAQVRDQVGAQVRDHVRDQVGAQVGRACYGQQDAGWLGFYDYFSEVCKLNAANRLSGMAAVAQAAGWWWPFANAVILTERPTRLSRDAANRLHCETGAAIEYSDGWGVYAWHGTRVPAEWITNKAALDPKIALTHENIEQRRAAAEIVGWARVLEAVGARSLQKSRDPEIGELLEADLPGAPGSRFLRVRCGTKREFVLPVPREMKTAREANAWTWGLSAREYRPEIRT